LKPPPLPLSAHIYNDLEVLWVQTYSVEASFMYQVQLSVREGIENAKDFNVVENITTVHSRTITVIRAQALATEIASKKPDIIGLQEVVLIRSQYPADLSPIPNASTIELDFLPILLDELARRGQNYEAVAVSAGFVDAWGQTHPGNPGFTCCQNSNQSNQILSGQIRLIVQHHGKSDSGCYVVY